MRTGCCCFSCLLALLTELCLIAQKEAVDERNEDCMAAWQVQTVFAHLVCV